MNTNQIRERLLLTNPESDLVEAFDRTLTTGSVLKSDICPVIDASGNPLEKEVIYRYQDKLIKVRRWEFGAGNMLDRYYRVFYTDNDLVDTFLVINAKYPLGVLAGVVYPSILVRMKTA
jgi:hypothetical protein